MGIYRIGFVFLTVLGLAWASSGCVPQKNASPKEGDAPTETSSNLLPKNGPTQADYPALHNLLQITDTLYSGGEPHGDEAFASLEKLGIKTIVSVDGAQPDLARAKKYGLRYVHIPIGYDGIDEQAGNSFARLAQEAKTPLYVHCHHGKHRGPAAAAITCMATGDTDAAGALAILEAAGTSQDYVGLWRDVENYQVPDDSIPLPELVEQATIESLAAAMAKIDRAYDHLKLCSDNQWQRPANHPDLVPHQEALLVWEGLRESARNLSTDHDTRFVTWLSEAEGVANQLKVALKEKENEDATAAFSALKESCSQCHKAYRN